MRTVDRLMAIESKLEHLEDSAEWIVKETLHTDNSVSQAGTLICVLADELRERIFDLVQELEQQIEPEEERITIH